MCWRWQPGTELLSASLPRLVLSPRIWDTSKNYLLLPEGLWAIISHLHSLFLSPRPWRTLYSPLKGLARALSLFTWGKTIQMFDCFCRCCVFRPAQASVALCCALSPCCSPKTGSSLQMEIFQGLHRAAAHLQEAYFCSDIWARYLEYLPFFKKTHIVLQQHNSHLTGNLQ